MEGGGVEGDVGGVSTTVCNGISTSKQKTDAVWCAEIDLDYLLWPYVESMLAKCDSRYEAHGLIIYIKIPHAPIM